MELLILSIILIILVIWLWNVFKIPKIGCIGMVTGGVKCGKSMLSVWLAMRKYKMQRFKWKIKCIIAILFRKEKPEEPLLYSNVHLAGIKYTLLTEEIVKREKRVAYGSVTYIQEASLLADSMYFKNEEVNERLLLFNKLYGHESKGGYLIYDTQSIQDNHYSVKRCINSYLWIHHLTKIPFFCILHVREMHYSEDSNVVNNFEEDIENNLKIIVIPKKVWKIYDAYCYSAFTDDLDVERKDLYVKRPKGFKRANLKTKQIISLKKFKTIREHKENERKEKTKQIW